MDFGVNKTPIEVIREGHSEELLILEAIILVLMVIGTEKHGNNLMSRKKLIQSITAQIIMMLVSINMVLNVQNR